MRSSIRPPPDAIQAHDELKSRGRNTCTVIFLSKRLEFGIGLGITCGILDRVFSIPDSQVEFCLHAGIYTSNEGEEERKDEECDRFN